MASIDPRAQNVPDGSPRASRQSIASTPLRVYRQSTDLTFGRVVETFPIDRPATRRWPLDATLP